VAVGRGDRAWQLQEIESVLPAFPSISTSSEPVVATRCGRVRGIVIDGVARFLGIPYAAPPFGANRFRRPVPPAAWTGVREALAFGPTAPQIPVPWPFNTLLREPIICGDDCLNLNVWTPSPGGSGLPVMVWIHGGAFRTGSSAVTKYDGATFARDGVVCVSLNYRLGVEGFANIPGAPANRGLLDQIAALTWVQDNIAAFGGDPGNVTVAGESAGAMSVITLLSLDRGLFRRAIAQSGGGHCAQSVDDAALVTDELARRLGIQPTATAFAKLDPDTILPVQVAISNEVASNPDMAVWGRTTVQSGMAFLPVIDGELVEQRPIDAIAGGAGANVPVLIGTNTDEYRLFLVPLGLIFSGISDDDVAAKLASYEIPPEVRTVYSGNRPSVRPGGVLAAIVSDYFFRMPAYRVAETRGNGTAAATHVYELAWRSPILPLYGNLGACHALELGFMWDTLTSDGDTALTGPNPPQGLATAMHGAWVGYMTSGDPGWAPFDVNGRPVQTYDAGTIAVISDPRADERELWADIVTP
jgi:carboxylesterase type B